MPLLKTADVTKRFGGLIAVNGMSLEVNSGQVVALIGPNGAGKSTLINLLSGLYSPDEGEIHFNGDAIENRTPAQIALLGVGRTFQIPRVFHRLTVIDNVLVPVAHRAVISGDVRGRARELLELVDLGDKAGQYARELSGGQQKLLELARALMAEPSLVLMDEPFAGVHPQLRETLIHAIREVNRNQGTTFLIVSHEMPVVAAMCNWVYAMHLGSNFLEGTPTEVLEDERLVDIYLGEDEGVAS